MVRRSSPPRKKKSPKKREANSKGAVQPPVSIPPDAPVHDAAPMSAAARRAMLEAQRIAAKRTAMEEQNRELAGRPSEYSAKCLKFVKALAALGATEFEIAQHLEINTATMWRWKATHPQFCKALEVGESAYLKRIKRTLKHRALGYSFEAEKIFYDSETGTVIRATTIEHVPPDVNAIKFVMTNLDPQHWKNRDKVDVVLTPADPQLARHEPQLLEDYYARLQSARPATGADPRVIEHLGPDGQQGAGPEGDPDAGAGGPVLPTRQGPR